MTTIEARVIEEGGCYGELEVVREVYRENGRLLRFRTVKREGVGIVIETGYCIDEKGILKLSFSEIHHSEDTGPFSRSDRYLKLNYFLQKSGR